MDKGGSSHVWFTSWSHSYPVWTGAGSRDKFVNEADWPRFTISGLISLCGVGDSRVKLTKFVACLNWDDLILLIRLNFYRSNGPCRWVIPISRRRSHLTLLFLIFLRLLHVYIYIYIGKFSRFSERKISWMYKNISNKIVLLTLLVLF